MTDQGFRILLLLSLALNSPQVMTIKLRDLEVALQIFSLGLLLRGNRFSGIILVIYGID